MRHARFFAVTLALATLAQLGCGADAGVDHAAVTAKQDCQARQALNQRCTLDLDIDIGECTERNAQAPAACRAATHAYVGCVTKLTCQAIADPKASNCVREIDNLDLSCPEDAGVNADATANGDAAAPASRARATRATRRSAGDQTF